MLPLPPSTTRTDTLFPFTTLFLSARRLFRRAHDHGLAGYIVQRLSGQAGGRRPGGDDGDEAHAGSGVWPAGLCWRSRASCSSMTGTPSRMGNASLSAVQIGRAHV